MAKIRENPVLRGKAAEAFKAYMENAKPDPEKAARNERDLAFHRSVPVDRGEVADDSRPA